MSCPALSSRIWYGILLTECPFFRHKTMFLIVALFQDKTYSWKFGTEPWRHFVKVSCSLKAGELLGQTSGKMQSTILKKV